MTQTLGAGQQRTLTLTSSNTANPTLSTESSTSSKGLSPKNKKIVIGCVVGIVGGLLALAALLFLYFRFYKQRKDERFVNSEGLWVTRNGNPDEKLNSAHNTPLNGGSGAAGAGGLAGSNGNRSSQATSSWKFWKKDDGADSSGLGGAKSPILDSNSLHDEDEFVFRNPDGSAASPTNRYTQVNAF